MMATSGYTEPRGLNAKNEAERRRLRDLLCDRLSVDLLRLLNEEIHTDVILHVGQTQYKVHKAVLWARAPEFYTWLTRRDTGVPFTVQNVEPSEMQTFLKLIYSSPWKVKDREHHILQMVKDQSKPNPERNLDLCDGKSTTLSAVENDNVPMSKDSVDVINTEENHNYDDLAENQASSDLGKDLLSLFMQSFASDVSIQVEETTYHVHRAILCARSVYFAAMLSGYWAETSGDLIKIEGVKPADMTVILHFIYGGVMDLPKNIDAGQILSVADMYGLEGLREVAIYTLKRDYCKFFLKPIAGMQQSVLECLYIAHSVGEEPLYTSCMRWIEKYFVKCWCERSFANLPADLQKSCLNVLVQSLSHRNAASLLMESDRLISSLPGVKWAERAQNLASELQEECVKFIVANFSQIIKSEGFAHLLQAQGMSSRPYLLEHVFNEIEKNISFQNSSSLYMAVDDLLHLASENEMVFTCKIQALRDKLWSFLVQSFFAVRHTEGWKLMRPSDQDQIQAVAFDKGDDRRLAKKPTFTSSQQNLSKSVKLGEYRPAENKRLPDSVLSSSRKMKSDSLGASGHTSHITRNSSGKGKEDDVKGKEIKKVVAKGVKETKSTEKIATARPKISLKTKSENNDQSKTETSASKGDGTGSPKPASSVRMATRPKLTNGSSNPPTKVKTLKKSDKDPASPVKGSLPSVKSANCNGELPHSSSSSGEHSQEHGADEQPNSATSSPPVNKTLKNGLDGPKDPGVGTKSKPTVRISNGTTTKRKIIEAESRESSSSSTKKSADEGNDSGLQKKKGNKLGVCTAQRPKSAPAALSKKQGDASNVPKSVSTKQPEAKPDTKLGTHSPSPDKHVPLNKKTTKPISVSASKTQPNVSNNKHGGIKTLVPNHKEAKAKIQCTSSKTSIQNHKPPQKNQSAAIKTNHSQRAVCSERHPPKPDAREGLVSVLNEGKQAGKCKIVEGADGPEDVPLSAHECCQDFSMGNQESMIQKPNLEHCHCQENNAPASVLPQRSNSKKGLTQVINETKAVNVDKSGAGDVPLLNHSSEQKSDCKNICDSENSKCADSSSESELCSVKEVERVPKQKERENMEFLEMSPTSGTNMQRRNNDMESCLQGVSGSRQPTVNGSEHFVNCSIQGQISGYHRDLDIGEANDSHENSDMHFIGQWNNHSGMLHERESPESESGSASTSSDDIKPRSEDYDAGGSQDDDGSNERGISKCSTMRCHDFLGRSSSDTSTPEELKGYDGSLRIDVKMKKDSAELFRVNSTSDDEGPRRRTEPWLQRDGPRHSANHTTVCSSVQFSQEIEHLSSSADETEDERSEAENAVVQQPPPETVVQPYQGIVNLAFDDMAEIDTENQRGAGNKPFVRSVLLSVDECEELGSDEGDAHHSHARKAGSVTPDVFEKNITDGPSKNEEGKQTENANERASLPKSHEVLEENSVSGQENEESAACKGFYKPTESELKSQARPCHLDLYTEMPAEAQRFCCSKTSNACKNQFLDYQGRDNHAPSSENSNTALSAGHIDDIDSMAQTCMYDHRPPKSLSPIYEMDPADGIEQRLKTEARIMDLEFEDQQFVERDWTLLRQLLADHGSDVDIINSVPEDLSLAQYLINQTLLLARENSKSQGKAWGDLSSPFEDSTSVTVTSFSPDECSSPHGEWTILELETHH
ncbi:LOW QUALITY PROTEIN: BTB/POZ domain-containing protein 8 [Anomaloglossus baeobatrachus]|uniref:LOW QUALITY PROTEIN: BTB/POZ domain-containing protein 8 n=1 Tax=Anomaloglossus baeobatrachus TaxID=238106 RepID=UPI003F5047B7